ncbi:glyoxalase [Acidocella aquatica]|uniref:Glyoxalase n=1 Tax=Acidocella aquatica TaxID=1922313 RepID=A0ABQ6A418_9PROT|nr:VOC family protein [Acidocella aquatica]GLR67191.1 glyoxalase [Acidocella aquatica]
MIELKDLSYVRLGTADLATAETFATGVLGLEVRERRRDALYLRSDQRAHSLCYFEGAPEEQIIGFEVENTAALDAAAAALEALRHKVRRGSAAEAQARYVSEFINFRDPTGNQIELVTRPQLSARRHFPSRDAGITGFNHVGLNSTDPVRDEVFWTQVCNARVSDRIGDIPLMRINAIHHTLALVQAAQPGIQHINHQVAEVDDVMRSYYFLREHNVPIVFGPGRHPTSGARFLYFKGPDGVVFEYSCGVGEIADEATHRPRQFTREPLSFCMWGATPGGLIPGV